VGLSVFCLYRVTGNKRFWGDGSSPGGVEVDPVGLMARRWFDLVATILVAATVYSVIFFWF